MMKYCHHTDLRLEPHEIPKAIEIMNQMVSRREKEKINIQREIEALQKKIISIDKDNDLIKSQIPKQ